MSKFLKLLGHYIRYPVDFLFLPVSIIFGYLHGLIKAKAMLSLDVVSHDFVPPTRPMIMLPSPQWATFNTLLIVDTDCVGSA